jgi:hypothetical protein
MSKKNSSTQAVAGGASNGVERRKAKRRAILDSFSVFVAIPKKGFYKLPVHDISDFGLGFDFDTEGEDPADFPIQKGDSVEVHFYLNQSLYLPLQTKVARVETKGTVRQLGVELQDRSAPGAEAFAAFLQLVDCVTDSAVIPAA